MDIEGSGDGAEVWEHPDVVPDDDVDQRGVVRELRGLLHLLPLCGHSVQTFRQRGGALHQDWVQDWWQGRNKSEDQFQSKLSHR